MANILLDVSPLPVLFPFATLPGAGLPYSAVPRGRVVFRVNSQVIAAKIATNTTSIRVRNILPANYAYVFEWAQADVILATDELEASQFRAVGELQFLLGDGAGARSVQLNSEGVYPTTLNAGSGRAWSAVAPFPLPMYNLLQGAPSIEIHLNDSDAVNATVAGLLNTTVTCLQYDIEQVFNVGVNYPVPVQVR